MANVNWWKLLVISCIPDVVIAWTAMKFMDDKVATFWYWFVALTVVQTLLLVKQIIAGSLNFRLYGRQLMFDRLVEGFVKANFPCPEELEDFDDFMLRVIEDESLPMKVRLTAQATWSYLAAAKEQGFFVAMRIESVCAQVIIKYRELYAWQKAV